MSVKRKYGWKPDLPDIRDLKYAAPRGLKKLPPSVDLRTKEEIPVFDQGRTSSCTGNSSSSALMFAELAKIKGKVPVPSRLFLYYNARELENSADQDCGACIRDVVKCATKLGACHETDWPFKAEAITRRPSKNSYEEGLKHLVTCYRRLNNAVLDDLKGCLAEGFPFIFGMTIYEGFESPAVAKKGHVMMPAKKERAIGGHAMLAMGYNDRWKRFLVLNSWGAKWGTGGYCSIPYKYLTDTNLADDFWTIRVVSD